MKKILAFTLTLILALSVTVPVSAEEISLEDRFLQYCADVLPENQRPGAEDSVRFDCVEKINGLTYFIAYPEWIDPIDEGVVRKVGDWTLKSNAINYPYDLGMYVADKEKIYTLEEAVNAGICADFSILRPYYLFWLGFYPKHVSDPDNKYEDAVFEKHLGLGSDEYDKVYYYEGYEHYSSVDEATPDFVVITLYQNFSSQAFIAELFGDYVLHYNSIRSPYRYGKAIYFPKEDRLVSIETAYKENPELIMYAFTEGGVGQLIGDMDNDRKITVKDATYIQKCLAELEEFSVHDKIYGFDYSTETNVPLYVSDFNRDKKRDIKDATSIQKHLAGLE